MSRVKAGGISIPGQRQVIPRWADDPVRRDVGGGDVGVGVGCPPGRKSGGGKRGRGGSSKQVCNN